MSKTTANPPLPGAMPGRTPENAQTPADFSPQEVAKSLLRATHTGTLATLDRNSGHPFASLVNIATDVDGAPLILVSRLAHDSADGRRVRRRFLSHHPKSELYAGFGDFAFWRMAVVSAHLNGGFARAADLTAAEVLTDVSDARTLVEAEADAIAHMNADHAEALKLYATKLLGGRDGDWRCVGLDPDGIELQIGQT